MSKRRALLAYLIVAAVLIAALLMLSRIGASPWLNAVAVVLAIGVAVRFVESLSVMIVGGLVAVLTVALPFAMLFAMRTDGGMSPLSYLGLADVVQAVLPTVTALVLLVVLKRKNGHKVGS